MFGAHAICVGWIFCRIYEENVKLIKKRQIKAEDFPGILKWSLYN